MLREIERAQRELTDIAAPELRTPIQPILKQGPKTSAKSFRLNKKIKSNKTYFKTSLL
jgi:hypothetical protein